MMDKQIFVEYGELHNRVYGPDVLHFPTFCTQHDFTYNTTGAVDMSAAMRAAIKKAWEDKKYIDFGEFGLRADDWPSPTESAQMDWIHIHLNPMREFWDEKLFDVPRLRQKLLDAGISVDGWYV